MTIDACRLMQSVGSAISVTCVWKRKVQFIGQSLLLALNVQVSLEHKPAQHDQAAVIDTPSLLVEVRAKLFNLCHFFNLKEDPQRVRTQCLHSATAASDNQTMCFLIGPRNAEYCSSILAKETHSNTALLQSQSAHTEERACGYSALSHNHVSTH